MRQLDEITIAQDGESAFFGGGVYSEQVIRTLWDKGYVAGKDPLVPSKLLHLTYNPKAPAAARA